MTSTYDNKARYSAIYGCHTKQRSNLNSRINHYQKLMLNLYIQLLSSSVRSWTVRHDHSRRTSLCVGATWYPFLHIDSKSLFKSNDDIVAEKARVTWLLLRLKTKSWILLLKSCCQSYIYETFDALVISLVFCNKSEHLAKRILARHLARIIK